MDIDRSFVDSTSGRTVVRDLVERRLNGTGRTEDDGAALAPIAALGDELALRPPADLRRLVVALHGATIAGARFDFSGVGLSPGGDLKALLQERGDGGKRFAALHGAVPMGTLRTQGRDMPICWLPEPFSGFRKGRVLGRGTDGQVILVERVLATFLMRILEDHVDGSNRYDASPGEDWRSPAGWLDWALGSPAAAVDAMDQSWFHALFPQAPIADSIGSWGGGQPAQLCGLLWCWLSGDGDGLASSARACADDGALLLRQAASLGDLDPADIVGSDSVAGLRARLAAGRVALGSDAPPPASRMRTADAALLPQLALPALDAVPAAATAPDAAVAADPAVEAPVAAPPAPDIEPPAAPVPDPSAAAVEAAATSSDNDEATGDPASSIDERPLNLADTAAIDPFDAPSPRSLPPPSLVGNAPDRPALTPEEEAVDDEYTDSGLWYAKNVDTHDAPLGYGDPQPAQALGLTASTWVTLIGIAAVLVGIAAWMVRRT